MSEAADGSIKIFPFREKKKKSFLSLNQQYPIHDLEYYYCRPRPYALFFLVFVRFIYATRCPCFYENLLLSIFANIA